MTRPDYRPFVPAPGQSNIAGPTPRTHAQARMQNPRAKELFGTWAKLGAAPFKGLTTDGHVRPGLFSLQPQDAPTPAMVAAVHDLLRRLSPEHRRAACHPVDSQLWRHWQNTEIYVEQHGLRLDEVDSSIRAATTAVLRASLSGKGYDVARGVMKLNRFLGDLVGGPDVLGEWAYIFCLFGEPSESEPWGWQLFGHHLSLNCLVIGRQMVLTPCFFGAEPNYADTGPFAGTRLFEDEERAGIALMRSLSTEQQNTAIVAHAMMGGDLPAGRRHFADNLHLGGAFQDNRIVPYEGLRGSAMSAQQRRDLMDLVAAYVAPLPEGPLAARLDEVERHLADTHFCWIGGVGEASPFYYRIQSPVIFIEFDHHAGVFLTNAEPAKFHVHTIVRTPNGNDYGIDLLRLHYQHAPHHRHGHRSRP
ncbi:MAG: DUF3500 domain-containing protein [Hyphomicrobiales bacterium]|nr:DUF3500 domain-containing protein [Hyphomicrobiales bacterium]